jgi:hypothetical protein
MRVEKVLGVIVGVLLLVIFVPVALGIISRSPIFILIVIALGAVTGAVLWGRRMDSSASKSWFIRLHSRGATQVHDRLLQDDDATRQRTEAHRRHHDAE